MWQTGVFIWTISDYFSRVLNAVASAMCELFNLLEKYPFFFLRRRVTTSLWAQYAAVIVCIMGSLFKCPSTILPTGIDIILFTECMVFFREPMKSITMLQADLLWYNLITVLQMPQITHHSCVRVRSRGMQGFFSPMDNWEGVWGRVLIKAVILDLGSPLLNFPLFAKIDRTGRWVGFRQGYLEQEVKLDLPM